MGIGSLSYEGKNPVLIDGTFACTSSPFSQTVSAMTYDLATSSFVLCVYALLSGNNEYLYFRLFTEIIMQLNYKWYHVSVSCDFEMGFLNAVRQEFPTSILNGCYFHWKQSNWRKLMKIGFFESNVKEVIQKISFFTSLKNVEIQIALNYLETIFVGKKEKTF
ncbi:LOW QUALITY PROTEIN: hypothetical protein HZS_3857 [Henneguya salminicola]|nr:LOW QUALITY PROTEIN: hypothetical protein HZS_3857 [Henneguya salminicola]